ncbi:DUF72 domain-containing protein [Massilia glaciei]|uniref:DUF72 domain-containing protein n=2 Tax=Massilia glaciei TaxID=1524097 RepID=A0A2U2I606_9BURK|nr:DUF72 domain-containing protein [Massilia glaciei]
MLQLGCAGASIPSEATAAFPAEGSHLERYASIFNTLEINFSFHRAHKIQTYARWADSVPSKFRFSVKLPKTISHQLRLAQCEEPLRKFATETAGLEQKLGCVLVQLPPSLQFDSTVADSFFNLLARAFPCELACEARHPSWFGEDATDLLRSHAIVRVIADPPKGQAGAHVPTTDTIYARLHGNPRVYYSSYPDDYLAAMARDIAVHNVAGRTVWCIFDNTASGAAVSNALTLLNCRHKSVAAI